MEPLQSMHKQTNTTKKSRVCQDVSSYNTETQKCLVIKVQKGADHLC